MDYRQQIWNWFKANTDYTDNGIAAIMGNLEAESNCEPNRKQGDFTTSRDYSTAYALQVDSGLMTRSAFMYDSIGWGLAQWTFPSRKGNLYDFAKARGTSIADLNTQLAFIVKEIKEEFSVINSALHDASVYLEAICNKILTNYENPYDQSAAVKAKRLGYAQDMLNKYRNVVVEEDNDWLRDWIKYEQSEADRHLAKVKELKARLTS